VREALSLAQLDHPGIVRYVAHGPLVSEGFYLAMEWLDGEDLSHTLARGPLTIEETIGLVRRVAETLSFAHSQGIVHRDIKPGNLFLPGGSLQAVKVVDFGVAKIKDFTGTWTRNGWMLGTPAYMAPEQARGEAEHRRPRRSFALACVALSARRADSHLEVGRFWPRCAASCTTKRRISPSSSPTCHRSSTRSFAACWPRTRRIDPPTRQGSSKRLPGTRFLPRGSATCAGEGRSPEASNAS
jgi:serine/threonine protein kinase